MSGTSSVPNTFATQVGQVPASQLDANWNAVTAYINAREVASGTLAARPVGVAGQWYFATDVSGGTLYFNAGGTWVTATPGLAGSGGWTDDGQVVRLTTPTDQVSIGAALPFGSYPVTMHANTSNELLAFRQSSQTWLIKDDTRVGMGGDPMLKIAPQTNDDLALWLASVTGGQRVYIWPAGQTMSLVPHTGIRPTFAVFGDVMIGDIVAIESNPMTLFIREKTGLAETALTTFWSANKAAGVEPDGGAQIVMAPFKNGGGPISDGFIQIVAYGGGTGGSANEIQFKHRQGSSTALTTWKIGGGANAAFYPNTDVTLDIGTAANRVRTIYSSAVLASAGASTTLGFVPVHLSAQTGDSGTGANTADTSLKTYQIPAGALAVNGDFIEFWLTYVTANNANNKTMTVKFGVTTLISSGTAVFTDGRFVVHGRIWRTGAATQTAYCISEQSGNNQTWNNAIGGGVSKTTPTETLSTSILLDARGQNGTAAANDIICDSMYVSYGRTG